MDNKGSSNQPVKDEQAFFTPGVGNISPDKNSDIKSSIADSTFISSNPDNQDIGNKVNGIFSVAENANISIPQGENGAVEVAPSTTPVDTSANFGQIQPLSPSQQEVLSQSSNDIILSNTNPVDAAKKIINESSNNPVELVERIKVIREEYYNKTGDK